MKITPYTESDSTRVVKTKSDPDPQLQDAKWWVKKTKQEVASSLFSVVRFLKENQGWRQQQAALYARLYANLPMWNYLGMSFTKLNPQYRFGNERPTMNVVQSCVDSLVSRLCQSKPKPMFLTQGGDYKRRKLAKDLNQFVDQWTRS